MKPVGLLAGLGIGAGREVDNPIDSIELVEQIATVADHATPPVGPSA
jgi:hypothetical protein